MTTAPTANVPISQTEVAWNRTPFDVKLLGASKTFWLSFIPVTVKGEIRLNAGINVRASAYRSSSSTSGVAMSGTAFGKVYAKLSAGTGVSWASAGLRGGVTLGEVRAAKNISVDRRGSQASYANRFDVELAALEGYAELYAEAFGQDLEKTLLTSGGFRQRHPVARASGTVYFDG